jgi:hypothetical protein
MGAYRPACRPDAEATRSTPPAASPQRGKLIGPIRTGDVLDASISRLGAMRLGVR